MSDAQDQAEHDAHGRPRDGDAIDADGGDPAEIGGAEGDPAADEVALDDGSDPDVDTREPGSETRTTGSMGPGEADLEELEGDDEGPQGPGLAGTVALALSDLKGALEALILVSDKPVPAMRLARLTRQDLGHVRRALGELAEDYRGRGIALDEIAGGYQFRTSPRYAPFVRSLTQQKPVKLTRAQLEVLAIIAYRQPVTRPEIDDVRGVDSGSAIKVLLERDVIKIIGKRDDAGRPMLYATTNDFLELFGLKALRDLPTLKEFAELTPESRDIYERRIGEPLPGQGQGMDLKTHYEAAPSQEVDDDAAAVDAAEEGEPGGETEGETLDAEEAGEPASPGAADEGASSTTDDVAGEPDEATPDGEWSG
jgi:segregation and condensation protein B